MDTFMLVFCKYHISYDEIVEICPSAFSDKCAFLIKNNHQIITILFSDILKIRMYDKH
ncbi:hypothetical protein M0Q50_05760 [bacterium]|nr:hypothetical protein [bacterium]